MTCSGSQKGFRHLELPRRALWEPLWSWHLSTAYPQAEFSWIFIAILDGVLANFAERVRPMRSVCRRLTLSREQLTLQDGWPLTGLKEVPVVLRGLANSAFCKTLTWVRSQPCSCLFLSLGAWRQGALWMHAVLDSLHQCIFWCGYCSRSTLKRIILHSYLRSELCSSATSVF